MDSGDGGAANKVNNLLARDQLASQWKQKSIVMRQETLFPMPAFASIRVHQ